MTDDENEYHERQQFQLPIDQFESLEECVRTIKRLDENAHTGSQWPTQFVIDRIRESEEFRHALELRAFNGSEIAEKILDAVAKRV
jgi:hypothetical protein